ncbi:MAG: DUF6020 family protein [Bdellovibrionota bacterium]
MIFILCSSYILKYPVLKFLNVKQPALIEAIAIPAQQIARDIKDNRDLSKDEIALLSNVIDVEKVPSEYIPYIFSKTKVMIHKKGNQNYIKNHKAEFLKFYISRFLKHPLSYFKGWIDQTRGYLNSGYHYWKWWGSVEKNDLGIKKTVNSKWFEAKFNNYLKSFEKFPLLQPLISIGFFNWLLLISLFFAIIRKDNLGAMLCIPLIMVVGSLLLANASFC